MARSFIRNGIVAILGVAALGVALTAYHRLVMRRCEDHFQLLQRANTADEVERHYREISRFFLPWNPYRERAERWMEANRHEWQWHPIPDPLIPTGDFPTGLRIEMRDFPSPKER